MLVLTHSKAPDNWEIEMDDAEVALEEVDEV